jgi:uncharacterized membrane protein
MIKWFISLLSVTGLLTGSLNQGPVVRVVLFYSSSCTHCMDVIADVLPPLRDQFGTSLDLVFVDVSGGGQGADLFRAAGDALSLPDDLQGRVPTAVIGSTALVGSDQIERRLGPLIAAGIAAGGVALPAIPGMADYDAHIRALKESQLAGSVPSAESDALLLPRATWADKFQDDLPANLFAIGVLALQGISLIVWAESHLSREAATRDRLRTAQRALGPSVWLAALVAATTLIAATDRTAHAARTAFAVIALLLVGLAVTVRREQSAPPTQSIFRWNLPLLAAAGLLVAEYLAYVEYGQNTASCGALGQCNSVQSSQYARLAGVPVGVLGVAGYALILATLLVLRFAPAGEKPAQNAVRIMVAFGVAFSTILTFLEPFVIGATCMWCVTSALIMLLMGWYTLPAGRAPQG